ncbi:MAG: hypothetical protein ACRDPJ_10110 [Nocardioidaceae bacterium]
MTQAMTTTGPNHPRVRLPERRLLRTFAFDPMSTRLSGRFLVLKIRFETRLRPGPDGRLVQVVDFDATRAQWYEPVDLNDPAVLAQNGLRPTEGDPRAHQQVVYAVAMSVIERFERFVGRRFRWRTRQKLRLVPHAFEGRNAYFDPQRRAILFGYYRADRLDPGANLPGQVIFTCLSTDIIAHEVTHAIVHRLRRYYSEATNPDVFAWHEAFADLVALFQHFIHRDVVIEAVTATSGDLRKNSGLLELAREFGESSGRGAALRSAIGTERTPDRFRSSSEPHERGACFVAAVFDAYLDVYQQAIADLLRIATSGSGVLPPGRLPPDLVTRVAHEAVKCADRMLGMVVRAFDYLPVLDVTFGDVVRAIVTADRKLYPDDHINLRGTLVEAMRRRGIYPDRVASLTDDALAWPTPVPNLTLNDPTAPIDLRNLILSATMDLDLAGEPGEELAGEQRTDEGERLFQTVTHWAGVHALEIGLDPSVPIALAGIHVAYRQAEDRQPRPELVIQLTQRRRDLENQALDVNKRPVFRAATTLIAGVDGQIEFVVTKPFPLADATLLDELPAEHVAHAHHESGKDRLRSLRRWLEGVEDQDALSSWTVEPAVNRLDFAAIHGALDTSRPPSETRGGAPTDSTGGSRDGR